MEKITIKSYNLSLLDEFENFLVFKNQLLTLLQKAFGDKYFGNDIYEKKIQNRDLVIYLSFEKSKVIGAFLIKDYEKMSGLAVMRQYRRKNLASKMILAAQKDLPFLYGEVAVTNLPVRTMLDKLHFRPINYKKLITDLLEKQNDKVTFVEHAQGYYCYVHTQDKYLIDRHKTFMMLSYNREDTSLIKEPDLL